MTCPHCNGRIMQAHAYEHGAVVPIWQCVQCSREYVRRDDGSFLPLAAVVRR